MRGEGIEIDIFYISMKVVVGTRFGGSLGLSYINPLCDQRNYVTLRKKVLYFQHSFPFVRHISKVNIFINLLQRPKEVHHPLFIMPRSAGLF